MGPPIDKGWAWMVCLGCHLIMFFVIGCVRTIGVLFVEFQEAMNCSSFETSMLLAVISATLSITTPAANALAEYFTSRVVIIAGSMLCCLGLVCAYFATTMGVVIVFMGIFMGVGISLQFSPGLVIVGSFFDKRRSLANGIVMSGGSIGQLLMPVLITHLVETYTFHGALLILAAIFLHACVGAMLITPLSFYETKKKPKGSSIYKKQQEMQSLTSIDEAEALDTERIKPGRSSASVYTDVYAVDFKEPCYASTGSLYFKTEEKRKSSLLQAKDRAFSEDTIVPYAIDPKPSLRDMCQAVCCCCFTCRKHDGPKMWDWNLFCNALFLIYVIGTATGNAGYVDLFMFLPPYFKEIGISKRETALLLAVGGGFDLFGRLLGGWFADLGVIKRHNIMAFCMGFTGATILVTLYIPCFTSAMVDVIVLGFTGGFYMSLFSIVIIDFLGLELMPLAFGMAILVLGLVNTFMPALLGMLRDVTNSYMATLHCCVILMMICSVAFASEPLARWYERKKLKKAGGKGYSDGPQMKVDKINGQDPDETFT